MKSTTSIIMALAVGANASGWANFCEQFDDKKVEAYGNCGIGVDMGNHGCLKETGRHSIRIGQPPTTVKYPVLAAYKDDNCQEEKGCNAIAQGGTLWDIDFSKQAWKFAEGALSYKWLDNCPTNCAGQCDKRDAEPLEALASANATEEDTEDDIEKRSNGKMWYCDDEDCKVNCGTTIIPLNPGCANNEYNRKSLFVKGLHAKYLNVAGYGSDNDCSGNPKLTFHASNGCNKLPEQGESWNVIGVQG